MGKANSDATPTMLLRGRGVHTFQVQDGISSVIAPVDEVASIEIVPAVNLVENVVNDETLDPSATAATDHVVSKNEMTEVDTAATLNVINPERRVDRGGYPHLEIHVK